MSSPKSPNEFAQVVTACLAKHTPATTKIHVEMNDSFASIVVDPGDGIQRRWHAEIWPDTTVWSIRAYGHSLVWADRDFDPAALPVKVQELLENTPGFIPK
jgi:hypothetical protein